MDWKFKWKDIEILPAGAQGKVYRVLDNSKYVSIHSEITTVLNRVKKLSREAPHVNVPVDDLIPKLAEISQIYNPLHQGVLKVLNQHDDPELELQAKERIKREIDALKTIEHSNLLDLIDYDDNYEWFVSRFYPNGALDKHEDKYTGKVLEALKSLRPLVDGISLLHQEELIHRDIKPQNIFIDSNDELILGDLGLVFDRKDTERLTRISENVGNWEYQPEWATGKRAEDPKPSFDVFSLAKLLWKMISGERIFRLWHHKDPENDLELLFPGQKHEMSLVNDLLAKCMFRREEDLKITNGSEFLIELDELIIKVENRYDELGDDSKRLCKICGKGHYEMRYTGSGVESRHYGVANGSGCQRKIFVCSNCGNVQFFSWTFGKVPDAWKDLE